MLNNEIAPWHTLYKCFSLHFNTFKTILTLSNPIFCHLHTPQLLFILGGKEVGGLLVIILQF
jgi:hypothetical protein